MLVLLGFVFVFVVCLALLVFSGLSLFWGGGGGGVGGVLNNNCFTTDITCRLGRMGSKSTQNGRLDKTLNRYAFSVDCCAALIYVHSGEGHRIWLRPFSLFHTTM